MFFRKYYKYKLFCGLFFLQISKTKSCLGCQNETIRAEEGREMFFVSPSFPNVNNAAFDCTWRLQAEL